MREQDLQDRIRGLARGDLRLFRNNVGVGTSSSGSIVRYGLFPGSPDLIGWRRVIVTPEMVGQTIGIAVGIEVKSAKGRISGAQELFIAHMQGFGCFAGIARSVSDALTIIGGDKNVF